MEVFCKNGLYVISIVSFLLFSEFGHSRVTRNFPVPKFGQRRSEQKKGDQENGYYRYSRNFRSGKSEFARNASLFSSEETGITRITGVSRNGKLTNKRNTHFPRRGK